MYRIVGADGRQYGPVTGEVLRRWIAEGRASGQTLTQAEGAPAWQPLASFPEFADVSAPPPLVAGAPATTNSLAVWGFVCGLLALTCGCCCYGFPFNLLGIIFSTIGLSQIRASRGREAGTALAVVGLILSLLSFMLGVVLMMFGLALHPHHAHWHFRRW
jgi:thiol:disulfide interchange protein